MPDEAARATLRLCASALGYPSPSVRRLWLRTLRLVRREPGLPGADALGAFLTAMLAQSLGTAAASYVEAFDFSADGALYLTFHEHGDDRRRGPALVALKQRIGRAGFTVAHRELPDFLPLLLELVAVAPEAPVDPLEPRLRAVADRLVEHFARAGSPYGLLFQALQAALPVRPATLPATRPDGEDAREPLPYPLEYR